jgi:hypothetical protein
LSYLLGVWLLLNQIPSETIADSWRSLPPFLCNNTIANAIEKFCTKFGRGDANAQEEMTLQQWPLPDESSHPSALRIRAEESESQPGVP